MTPEEKWERIKNPQTLGDRDLSLTRQEMIQIEELAWIRGLLDDNHMESNQKKRHEIRHGLESIYYPVLSHVLDYEYIGTLYE
jgi:hypothetical protein